MCKMSITTMPSASFRAVVTLQNKHTFCRWMICLLWLGRPKGSSRCKQAMNRLAGRDGHGAMELVVHDRLRIQAKGVKDRRGDVIGPHRLIGRPGADGIGGAVDLSAVDAA